MARRRAIPTVWRQTFQAGFWPASLGLAEYVLECEESVDLLSGCVDSSCAAGKGRTNSSAGAGGKEPLMAITGLPISDLVLYSGALIYYSRHPPLLHMNSPFQYHVRVIK